VCGDKNDSFSSPLGEVPKSDEEEKAFSFSILCNSLFYFIVQSGYRAGCDYEV